MHILESMNLQPAPTKPAAGNRHAERSEATRAQLIQAAIQVVRDKSYQGASVFEVAKAAGLTPGAFQHHFGTKAVLMMRVVDELVAASDYNAPGWPAADLPLTERARQTLQLLWQRIYEPERFLVAWQVYMGCGADPEITRYIAGLRQTQIAARLGISQPAVASALALLRLPEAVQQFIASGQLSASHGRVLVRWSDLSPAYTLFVARYCVSQSVTVAQIEGDAVPWSWDAERAKLLVTLRDGSPVDWQTICRDGCPHGAYRGHNDWTGYCFRPECYAELATAAAAAKAA